MLSEAMAAREHAHTEQAACAALRAQVTQAEASIEGNRVTRQAQMAAQELSSRQAQHEHETRANALDNALRQERATIETIRSELQVAQTIAKTTSSVGPPKDCPICPIKQATID